MRYIACAANSDISTCITNNSDTNAARFKDLLDDSPGTGTDGRSFTTDEYDNINTINTFLDSQQQDIQAINAKIINLTSASTQQIKCPTIRILFFIELKLLMSDLRQ